ncbi:retrotransposon protein, putative, ty1-copia subclass [Tanacetum coccineum]
MVEISLADYYISLETIRVFRSFRRATTNHWTIHFAPWTATIHPEDLALMLHVKGQMEVAGLMLLTMTSIQRNLVIWCFMTCPGTKSYVFQQAEQELCRLVRDFSIASKEPFANNVVKLGTGEGKLSRVSHRVDEKEEAIRELELKVFQKEVENQLGKTIKSLRSDRGGEYMSQEFLDHLKEHGIIAHRTPPYTPQNNGVSERRNRKTLARMTLILATTPRLVSSGKYNGENIMTSITEGPFQMGSSYKFPAEGAEEI